MRQRLAPLTLSTLALFAAPAATAVTGVWHQNDQSRVRLVTPWETAPANGEVRLGLEFETEPGWHVYWKNAGDAGYPPAIDFAPTPAVAAAEILWPAPQRYELPGDLVAFGYEGQVIYPLALTWQGGGAGALTLAADLDYLVCEVDCVPYSYRLSVEQPLAAAGEEPVADAAVAPRLAVWERRLPRPAGELAGVDTGGRLDLADPERPVLVVNVDGAAAAAGGEPRLFLETHERFDADRPELTTTAGGLAFRVPLTYRERPDAPLAEAEFAWTVTGLAVDGEEVAVEARRTVTAAPLGATASAASRGRLAALPAALLAALLGGLLLALTPTVLPLWLAGWRRVRPLAAAAGCLAGGLALLPLAALGRAAGLPAAWGAPLQEPVVVAALALAATLAALHLWGLLGRRFGGGGVLAGAALGLVSVALALPWNVPFVAAAVGPALAADGPGGSAGAVAVVAALGLGLAAPWLAAAALRRHAAPTPPAGERCARRAEALAFVEAGSALWLVYLLSHQVSGEGLALVELAMLGVALAAWASATLRRRGARFAAAALVVALAAAGLWLADDHRLGGGGSEAESRIVHRTP